MNDARRNVERIVAVQHFRRRVVAFRAFRVQKARGTGPCTMTADRSEKPTT
ncbi:hypothetical protein [Albimonas pacifica]|uniref:hypothetical protein n=1 Tax=Albimonas pacifica TaxID=1114924 RepID=UPI0015A5CEC7|nr:hypothetical protein [Albimonas pacifica]